MADLLGTVVEAHGGHKRWNELETVTAHLAQGGVLWALKGQQGVLDDVFVTASLHEERESHYPFGAAGRRSVFTLERVAIETADGTVVEALEQPRASFAGHTAHRAAAGLDRSQRDHVRIADITAERTRPSWLVHGQRDMGSWCRHMQEGGEQP